MLHCSRVPRKRARRTGAVAVEMAITVSFLTVVTMGTIEVSRAIQVKHLLTDAARSSCRLAALPTGTNAQVTSNVNAILTANGINPSLATITIQVNDTTKDVSKAQQYDKVSVKISLPLTAVNWVTPRFFSTSSIESGTLAMLRLR